MMARIHELLLEAIADDLGEPPDALRPRLVAAAAIAALTSLEGKFDEKTEQRGGPRPRRSPCSTTPGCSCAAGSTRCRTSSERPWESMVSTFCPGLSTQHVA